MSYSIDGGAPINETFAILQKDSTRTYSFTQKIDFSSITGKKTIRVWSNLSADALKSNDTLEIEMENYITPPKLSVLSDTVCQNELTSTLEAISVPGFTTNWFTDPAGVNKVDQGDFKVFTAPFVNSTFYVNSTYEKFDSEGLPNVVNATAEVTTSKGLNFTVLRPRIRIHSVKVEFTVPGLSRVEVRTSGGVLIKQINYTVVNAGLNEIDLNVDLNAGTYRIMLTINPGASLTTVVNANPFNPIIPNNGSISITSAVGTTNQYPYFYDWVVSYPYCTSAMDSVKLVRVTGQNSPSLDLRDSSLCSYPAFFLDGQNVGMRYKWNTNDTTQNLYVYGKHSFGSNETALNDFFKYKEGTTDGEFVYKFEFTDWDKEINGTDWGTFGAGTDEQGINKNFKIEYYLKDGKKDILNFEFGNTLNNYYGFMGLGLKDSDLTYREIDKTTGALTLVDYDDFIGSFETGEIRYVKVDRNGNGARRVLVTKDPNGQLRLIEAIGGKGTKNHKTLLKLMGYEDDAIEAISLG
jgi:hypothetical protein